MLRFLALIWNSSDPEATGSSRSLAARLGAVRPDWDRVFWNNGIEVWASPRDHAISVCALSDGSGVVLGTVFRTIVADGPCSRLTRFDAAESRRILMTKGRYLIESFWGRYVAVLTQCGGQEKLVIRDPAGGLECLTATVGRVVLFFSAAEDYLELCSSPRDIDWEFVVSSLIRLTPEVRRTGFKGITRLLRGERATIRLARVESETLWDPMDIIRSGAISNVEESIDLTRTVTRACVRSWASLHQNIIVRLSGGLDSSIVLGCLRDATFHGRITCVHSYYSRGSNSDEREYARLAAAAAGVPLLEYELDTRVHRSELEQIPRGPSPISFLPILAGDRGMRTIARDRGVQALLSGEGGDEVFFESAPRYACRDHVWTHGFNRGLILIAMREALMERNSLWQVLLQAGKALLSDPGHAFTSTLFDGALSEFIDADAQLSALKEGLFVPAWIRRDMRISPGKVWQIWAISYPNVSMGFFDRREGPDDLNPLFSQPLIELCLRIPTTTLSVGGRDRAIARLAFSECVPLRILRRRTKAVVDEYLAHIVQANSGLIRERLFDGTLARRNLLNRANLERALTGKLMKRGHANEICTLFAAEVWLSASISDAEVPHLERADRQAASRG